MPPGGNRVAPDALCRHQTSGQTSPNPMERIILMLPWALAFLVIALIAAALGFGGIAGALASIAQVLFVVFFALFVLAMVARALRGQPPV